MARLVLEEIVRRPSDSPTRARSSVDQVANPHPRTRRLHLSNQNRPSSPSIAPGHPARPLALSRPQPPELVQHLLLPSRIRIQIQIQIQIRSTTTTPTASSSRTLAPELPRPHRTPTTTPTCNSHSPLHHFLPCPGLPPVLLNHPHTTALFKLCVGGSGAAPAEVAGQDRARRPKPLARPLALNEGPGEGSNDAHDQTGRHDRDKDSPGHVAPLERARSLADVKGPTLGPTSHAGAVHIGPTL